MLSTSNHRSDRLLLSPARQLLTGLTLLSLSFLPSLQAADSAEDTTVSLRVLGTTDLHSNMMDFNYYRGESDPTIGLVRTSTLIENARLEQPNIVLVDNGDVIQGSAMGDLAVKQDLMRGQTHPAFKAMNLLNYSAGNIGNHEFNYGLNYLHNILSGAGFPYINANVYCAAEDCAYGRQPGDNLFTPYTIEPKTVTDIDGDIQVINVGYIGFVTPQIVRWDKAHLNGKVTVEGIVETAEKFIPEMRARGADIIVALSHSGIGSAEYPGVASAENATYGLTYVDGIDAIVAGHSHTTFPHERYAELPNTDIDKGLLNSVPVVIPGRWGDHLGIIDLELRRQAGFWRVEDAHAEVRAIYDSRDNHPFVEPDRDMRQVLIDDHEATLEFVTTPIGQAAADLYSYLALVQDDPTVQIVSDAQIDYVTEKLPEALQDLPVLSASAPFKAGGRHSTSSDADQYVQVNAGPLTYRNAADLYLYPNTVVALKVTGAELKDWLECSANMFTQIDPTTTEAQQLINWSGHPTFNFDVIDGVSYQIDVTQPARFDRDCNLVNESAERITDLSFTNEAGETITGDALAEMEFIVASNNYRAFSGQYPGTGSDNVVLELPDANRDALAAYISEASGYNPASNTTTSEVNPSADNNWQFAPIETEVDLDIRFETQASEQATAFIAENQQYPMQQVDTDEIGFAVYEIELSNQ